MGHGPSGDGDGDAGPSAGGRLGREALLAFLLVLGGAAALLHETAWFRMLGPVLGAGALTGAAVSAGALLGLALGAAVGARAAAVRGRPLLVLAVGEGLAALLCLAVPAGAVALADLVHATTDAPGGAGEALTAVFATLLCSVAAFPMGLSVPAALRALAPAADAAGAAFRRLYAWNTLGAVAGVLVGAGWLIERAGNRGTVSVAALAQGGVAALALLLAWRWPRASDGPRGERARRLGRANESGGSIAHGVASGVPLRSRQSLDAHASRSASEVAPPPEPPAVSDGSSSVSWRALAAAFLAGGAGLVTQVAWVRRLTPAVGTTTQAFATVLAAYLAALALGSLLLGPRRGGAGGRRSAFVLALAALPVALLPAAIAPIARWAAERALVFQGDELDLLLLRTAAAGLLLVPSVLLGAAALPWLVHEEGASGAAGTRRAGRLLAWNTAGSAVLALVTGLVWLPAVGSAAVLRGAAGLLLGAAALRSRALALPLAVLALALLVQPFVRPFVDAAGRDAVGAAFLPGEFAVEGAPALYYAEGRATTVVVRDREGRRELWMEGKIEASTQPTDLLHLTLLGSIPMALHPAPKRAGVIGLGTGRTAKAVAAFGPERLVIFELEREVVRASVFFEDEGAGIPAGAEVAVGDARRSLRARAERFDVLTSDPVHPGVAGSALLYSREAYLAVKERLEDRGLFCQWLPLYQMTADDLRLVLRTLLEVFPETHLFQSGMDLVVVASAAPVRVDEAALRARLLGPAGLPLAPLGLRTPGRLLALHLKAPAGVKRFAGPGELNTDDRLLLEFRAGRAWFFHDEAGNAGLLQVGRARGAALLAAPPTAAFQAERARPGRATTRPFARGWAASARARSRSSTNWPRPTPRTASRRACATACASRGCTSGSGTGRPSRRSRRWTRCAGRRVSTTSSAWTSPRRSSCSAATPRPARSPRKSHARAAGLVRTGSPGRRLAGWACSRSSSRAGGRGRCFGT